MALRSKLLFLALVVVTCGVTQVEAAPWVLMLDTRHRVGYQADASKQITGLLPREIARQSLLIAAREELGLATRDASLRESTAEGDEQIRLLLTVDAALDGNCHLTITQGAGTDGKEVWKKTLKVRPNSTEFYPSLITQVEELARQDFVELLVELGAQAPDADSDRTVAAPPESELVELDALQGEVDLLDQYLAIRRIERLMGEHGESPELLGRLANGYANLGILTECGWGATSRVMKARAMLYVERLLVKHPDYVFCHWHWAYVRALVGIHFAALQALENPLPEGVDSEELPSLPAWAEVIEAYCRFDTSELGQQAELGNKWARYLRYWSFYLADEKRSISTKAEETVKDCPWAFNLYYFMGTEGSLGIMHQASRASLGAMYYLTATRMKEMDSLPDAIRRAAGAQPTEDSYLVGWGKAIAAMREESDTVDPSWQTLATMLEDTAVLMAVTNLRVATGGSTEQSLAPYVDLFQPALAGHPQRSYFASRKFSLTNEPDKITEVCRDLRFEDPSLWLYQAMYYVWDTHNARGERIGCDASKAASRDFTASSLFVNTQRSNLAPDFHKMLLREMGKVSPYSPMVLANEIELRLSDANAVRPDLLTEWQERAGSSAKSWHQLAKFYMKRLEYDEACRCYETSYHLSPSFSTVRDWGWAYEYAKQLDKVVPTMKLYLEEEDHGLGHSNTHYEIARFYLRHKRVEEAKPHALEAAESWSSRGLWIAATTCERLELTDEAEKWFQANSRAYPTYAGLQWYLWRKRAGIEANIDEPRQFAERQLGTRQRRLRKSSGWWPLVYYIMEEDHKAALEMSKQRSQDTPRLYSDCFLLTVALDANDADLVKAGRDKLRQRAESDENADNTWVARYSKAVLEILDAESAEDLELETFDAFLRDDKSSMGWCDACYFFSKFFQHREFSELADRYRDWAISFQDHDRITWHLAKFEAQRTTPTEGNAAVVD